MQLLENWLKGAKNFLTGRILYNQYGTDAELKKLFAKGETPGAKAKLLAAMEALVKKETAAHISVPGIRKMPESNDAIAQSIHADWKEHYSKMNLMRHQLDSYGTSNSNQALQACNELCKAILEEERYVNACWEKLKHYEEQGQLPEIKDDFEIPSDPVKLAKKIASLQRNIRRNKQKAAAHLTNALYPSLIKRDEQYLKMINDAQKN